MKLSSWIIGLGVLAVVAAVLVSVGMSRQERVLLYYYDAKKDMDANGVVMCSRQGLVPVERMVASGDKTIRRVVQMLLEGNLTEAERARGILSDYPLPGVELTDVALQNGIATLAFKDPQHKLGGGACRATILWLQIDATARQFPGVHGTRFTPEDLFQP
jgi:hypothetical protein